MRVILIRLGMVAYACSLTLQKAEAGESLAQGQIMRYYFIKTNEKLKLLSNYPHFIILFPRTLNIRLILILIF